MAMYHYVYVLLSQKDGEFYVGYTKNVQKRVEQHNSGQVQATKHRMPMKLIYWEGCINQQDATRREKYLKSMWGKRYIKGRVRNDLKEVYPVR
jgi:putative endonuclease